MTRNAKAYRAAILHSIADPAEVGVERSYEHFEDGLLLVEDGKVARLGDAETLLGEIGEVEVFEYRDALITPGFIDTHIHFPQTGMIASYGEQLLDWLNTYTFPTERQFGDQAHADQVAEIFLQELLRNGTTTALVFGSVHRQSVESLFEAARRLDLRLIAGKVMMDRNAPDYLTDTAESSYRDSKALIERWHGQGRLLYAVTPRFAPTSTAEQLDMAARLLREHPGVYLHTHLSENLKEIEWVKELFPERSGYLDVYDHHGLLGPRSVFAHGVHLCDGECQRLAETGSAVAFCPTSNLFLGSGLFDLPKLERYKVKVGLGTDVGAGTSFSQLQSLNEAYKVMQLQGARLDPFKSLYLATLGGARALELDDRIGSFATGNEADFVVLDYHATPLLSYRLSQAGSLAERLFALTILGDDRTVKETFAAGRSVHRRDCLPAETKKPRIAGLFHASDQAAESLSALARRGFFLPPRRCENTACRSPEALSLSRLSLLSICSMWCIIRVTARSLSPFSMASRISLCSSNEQCERPPLSYWAMISEVCDTRLRWKLTSGALRAISASFRWNSPDRRMPAPRSPRAKLDCSCTTISRNSARRSAVALSVASSVMARSTVRRAKRICRASSMLGLATTAPRFGRNSTTCSWARRERARRMMVRLTPNISPSASSLSLVPGARRCSRMASKMWA